MQRRGLSACADAIKPPNYAAGSEHELAQIFGVAPRKMRDVTIARHALPATHLDSAQRGHLPARFMQK
jgi:hypothetical protein